MSAPSGLRARAGRWWRRQLHRFARRFPRYTLALEPTPYNIEPGDPPFMFRPPKTPEQRIYLERYALNGWTPNTKERRTFVFLHRFWGPDPDRGLHNHPSAWAFSIGLSGGYVEARPFPLYATYLSAAYWLALGSRAREKLIERTFRAPFINWIAAKTFHRITRLLAPPGETWTLFVMGPKHGGGWGFFLPGRGFVNKREYDTEFGRLEEWES